jgi:hypothetical protein
MRLAPIHPRARIRLFALALALLAASAASPSHATTRHGTFDRPPYYHGKLPATVRRVSHVPVSFRTEPGSLDPTPDRSPALAGLLDSLRSELDRSDRTRPLAGGDRPDMTLSDGPAVRFGARRGGTGADGIPLAASEIDTREPRRMDFEYDGPGRAWKQRVGSAAGDSVHAVVVVQLGFADHWVRQTSWKGSKSIEIGTGRSMPVGWLTSLDDPVQVLQLTGALVTPAGKVLRMGSEGLLARRTGMAASTLGAQEVLTEQEIATLLTAPAGGTPVWRAALRDLVAQLLDAR